MQLLSNLSRASKVKVFIESAHIDKMVEQVDASDVSWAIYNLCWKMDSFGWIQNLDTLCTDTKGKCMIYMYPW